MASNKCDETVIPFVDVDAPEADNTEEDSAKKKKKKDETAKENSTSKPAQARGTARTYLVGTKPPGPASKTGVPPLSKQSASGQTGTSSKAAVSSSKSSSSSVQGVSGKSMSNQMQHKTSNQCNQTKVGSSSINKSSSSNSQPIKTLDNRKSPCPSPNELTIQKDAEGYDGDEAKLQESTGPKVPPLKIVIPGGVGSAASSSHQQEGDGCSGQRSGSKSQSNNSILPYVMPFNAGNGDSSDHDDGKDDKKHSEDKTSGSRQRVLRSHRTADGEKEKDSSSPDGGPANNNPHSSKSPPPQSLDTPEAHSSKDHLAEKRHSTHGPVDLHPRKRKIKASKEHSHHAQVAPNDASHHQHHASLNEAMNIHISHNSNPYQMYLNIRRQVDRKHKGLFPVQPKPPEGFDDYLMNKCTYVLSHTVKATPVIVPPVTLTDKLHEEYKSQEKQRNRLRIQHVVEKEKLVLAVEQEILRVHGRAARALANQYVDFQTCPFSVCTMLRNSEIYSLQTPEQEEKERNAAQRSRYNGRLFLSWLQDVDDKWDKIKEGMVRRHHTEAESLHAMQRMMWGWKMKELALCDYKTSPSIDETHVPMIKLDVAELKSLLEQAKRKRVQDFLSLEIRKMETELISIQESMQKINIAESKPSNTSDPKRYQVKLNGYGWDQSDKYVKIFVTLKDVQNLSKESVYCTLTEKSMELHVDNLDNKDYILIINKLLENIDVEASHWKQKTDMVVVFLAKSRPGVQWSHMTELEKKADDGKANKFKTDGLDKKDPQDSIMGLMKNMYETGDDNMKRMIAKAWTEGQDKRGGSSLSPELPDF